MELGKSSLGITNPKSMVRCMLTLPRDDKEEILYNLFVSAGEPYEDDEKRFECYSPYVACIVATGRYGCKYLAREVENGIPWAVPEWALALAVHIRSLVKDAESIGSEQGYNQGLEAGKKFVMRLAKGDMAPNEYMDADGRDPIRLGRKKW